MKNIFISYSHKDAQWKDLLVSHLRVLEKEGLCILWHDRDIALGRDWFPDIDAAIDQAHLAILLISKDFLVSEFIEKEEIPRILTRRGSGELGVAPLFLKPYAWDLVTWLKGIQGYPDDGRALADGNDVEIEKKLVEFTKKIAAYLRCAKSGDPFSLPVNAPKSKVEPSGPGQYDTVLFTRLPYRQIDLIGRQEELQELAQRLADSRRVLLVNGLGGIGKTEVCKSFFMDHYHEYAYAGWFDWASSLPETLVGAFTWDSPLPGLADTGVLEERYESIMGFLQRLDAPALLVLDNIDIPADKQLIDLTCLPERVKVIANSRAEVPGFEGWRLEFLSAELCRELFYKYYDVEKDDDGVNRVVERCGRHTLTVELLARTARNAAMRLRDLERLLDDKGFNLNLAIKAKVETRWHEVIEQKPFFEHLLTVFDLSGVSVAELALMVNLAVLPAVYISLEELKDWLGLEDLEAARTLEGKGWLRREKGNIYMHPVVQEVTRVKAAPGVKDCERLIVSLCNKLYNEPGDNPLDKQGYVVFAAVLLGNIVEAHEKIAALANNVSTIYYAMGQLEKALEFQLKALDIREQVLAKNHPDLATSYNNVSLIYQDMGQLEKALEFQLKALEIREKVLAKNHPSLATSYNNVSLIYQDMGQLEKALEFQLKALEIREKVLAKNHPSLATSYNNVSMIYKAMGQLEKALEFQLKTIDIKEKVLAKNHPSLATSYNNVSMIYKDMGQLEKALEFQLKALDISEKVLAKNHPSLATSYNNLSLIYRDMEDIAAARPYAQKAVDILQSLFPGGHPHLTYALNNLAILKKIE